MVRKLDLDEFYKEYNYLISYQKEETMYVVYDKTQVDYGCECDCDLEWCKENNIPVFKFNRGGGCIVNTAGNITLIDMRKFDGHTWNTLSMLKSFVEFLRSKGIDATIQRNDIMIDGFKVGSGVCRNIHPRYIWQLSGIQISINQDLNVIEHACKKTMRKTPKGLSDFGITTEDVEQWIDSYFNKENQE